MCWHTKCTGISHYELHTKNSLDAPDGIPGYRICTAQHQLCQHGDFGSKQSSHWLYIHQYWLHMSTVKDKQLSYIYYEEFS